MSYICVTKNKKNIKYPTKKNLVLYKKTQKYYFFHNFSCSRLISREKLLIHIKVTLISYNLSRTKFVRKVVSLFVRIKKLSKKHKTCIERD